MWISYIFHNVRCFDGDVDFERVMQTMRKTIMYNICDAAVIFPLFSLNKEIVTINVE